MAIEQEMLNSSHDMAAGSQQQSGRLGWDVGCMVGGGAYGLPTCACSTILSLSYYVLCSSNHTVYSVLQLPVVLSVVTCSDVVRCAV